MRIKICGITTVADAIKAAQLGADAIGLNFYAKSKRFITTETANEIARQLPPFVDPVGLFVNEPVRNIIDWADRIGGIRSLQLHADEHEVPPLTSYRFIPAFPVRDTQSLATIEEYLHRCDEEGQSPAAILVDAHVAGEYGGTGKTAPWHLLADFHIAVPMILAGGLTAVNVAEAVRIVQPYAVDVASGVESTPGVKDIEKIKRFINEVREATAKLDRKTRET